MNEHNNTNGGHDEHRHMMWTMLICCALPLILLVFGGSLLSSGGYLPKVIIGAVAIVCAWMMFRGHGHANTNDDGAQDSSSQPQGKDKS